jgi:RNA polymerase sigma factor (sigma-70 family)
MIPVNRFSSQDLIKGIRKRDYAVITYIYHKYFQSVLHFIMNNNGTTEDAKDTFQEAMIVVFENIRKDRDFKIECSLPTYIFSVARIIWIKHLNKMKNNMIKLNENHEYIEFEEPQPFQEHDFKYDLYQRVFLELPQDCQQILKMSNEGIGHKEIASRLGFKSENYISKRKHFCKEYLIKLIRENPDFHSDKL